ncbi:hypothetical protein N7489_003595 [Penicillium chrysogenum]|uniref:uncharacterized protein n=1 Tax=Penicillium chrysogenum TaxID=5076 RepID=UPI0024DF1A0F|nr:uncharacterized protein N7489_003595 [Penicillium chrysogenum]KAJ5253185.1 hypothetical protein N7489_003595 [Penicillium chrysogenum]
MLPRNTLLVCEVEDSPNGGSGSCFCITKRGTPCKNSTKSKTPRRPSKLTSLWRESFDLSNLQSKLCAIAKEFLYTRWHRQTAGPIKLASSGMTQPPATRRKRHMTVELTLHPLCIGASARPAGALVEQSRASQSINPFVTPAILRTDSVPWHISPAQPAILTSVTYIWAGVQDLTLRRLSLSGEVGDLHCVFCLAEDEEQANKCVILRCDQCQAHAHTSCAEEWLEKRNTVFGTSCCVW